MSNFIASRKKQLGKETVNVYMTKKCASLPHIYTHIDILDIFECFC